jgi:hypothetical protein
VSVLSDHDIAAALAAGRVRFDPYDEADLKRQSEPTASTCFEDFDGRRRGAVAGEDRGR